MDNPLYETVCLGKNGKTDILIDDMMEVKQGTKSKIHFQSADKPDRWQWIQNHVHL